MMTLINRMVRNVALAAVAWTGAQALAESALPVDVEAGADILTKYVWRGQLLVDDPVIQPSVTVSYGGLSLNLWGSINTTEFTTGDNEDYKLQEVDYTLSYSFAPVEGLGLTAGIIQYDFPGTGLDSTRELFAAAEISALPLTPTLAVYYDVDEVDGWYANLSIGHSFAITEKLSLGLGAAVGYGDSDYHNVYFGVDDSGLSDMTVGASLDYAVNDVMSLSVSLNYVTVLDSDIENGADATYGDSDNVVAGIGCAFAF